ncbi:hypothetical protein C2S51_001014 [Perilla frutescens var. frutescens]|nr:hypothetical protein C2S51_001014 [Perilla frutescens var. frutescens]
MLVWNAQGLGSKAKYGYLHNLICLYRLSVVVVIEPKVVFDPDFYGRRFGMTLVGRNCSNHIWVFCASGFSISVEFDYKQLLHVRVDELWEQLRDMALMIEGRSWLVGGDFNIFLTDEEVDNGVSDRHREMMDFGDAISDCQLVDPGFNGAWFT